MRRREKEIHDPAALRVLLERAVVCRLAFADRDEPYLVPVLFALDGGRLYVHSAREGRKMEILRRNPRVCFEVEGETRLLPAERPCDWSLRYRSVIGRGRASLVEEPAERRRALDLLVAKYERLELGRPAGPPALSSPPGDAPAEAPPGPMGRLAAAASSPPGSREYREAALQATAVLRIDIEEMTGKGSDR